MEIARRNIFDEIIGNGSSTYESAILTCFSFDPLYFVQYYLPKLNAINITNVIVLIDAGQYDEACEEFLKYKESAHRSIQLNFSPVRISPSFHGVFHPKIALFVGPRQCTALVGSGNLTYGGMTYNNEVWNAFSVNKVDSEEALVIADVWHYLQSIIPEQNTVREQLAWMTAYSDCLKSIDNISKTGSFRFLVNTDSEGIGSQLLSIIGNEPVKYITIVSPYYDSAGSAIAFLYDNLHPQEIVCLGDEETGTWPVSLREDLKDNVAFKAIKDKDLGTRTHAKIFQIQTDKSTYLLSGSANATSAGLGLGTVKNDEAVILTWQGGLRNFIEEMGITPGELIQPVGNPLTKDQKNSKSSKEVTIQSCELWNGFYLLELDKELADVHLYWKDASGNDRNPVYFEHLDKSVCIEYGEMPGAVSVIFKRDECVISNRVLILADSVIQNYCPDKTMKQLSRLMDVSKGQDWDSNITKILSFVTFEETMPVKVRRRASSRTSSSSAISHDTIIDRNDFSPSALESDASRRNNRILEYFFRFISSDDHESDDIEEEYTADEIDKGTPVGDEGSMAANEKRLATCKRRFNELEQYLNRLVGYYSGLCKKLDDAAQPILLDSEVNIQRKAMTKSYSSCLIAIVLLCQLAKDTESGQNSVKESSLFKRLVELLGRFTLVFRDASVEEDCYLAMRIQEMKQNLLVYSFVLLSHFDGEFGKGILSELLVLNLLDMFKDDTAHLKQALELFETGLENSPISLNCKSLALIRQCVEIYLNGCPATCTIDETSFPAIIYKKKLGFLLCSEVQRSKATGSSLEYEILVSSPGFKNFEPVWLQNGNKLPIFKYDLTRHPHILADAEACPQFL